MRKVPGWATTSSSDSAMTRRKDKMWQARATDTVVHDFAVIVDVPFLAAVVLVRFGRNESRAAQAKYFV